MPLDELKNALVQAFEKPYGEDNGPHIARMDFKANGNLQIWRGHAYDAAKALGIEIVFKNEYLTLHVATRTGEHYSQIVAAM